MHLHVLAGRERAGRKRGRRFRCIRCDGTRLAPIFCNAPDLHTPLCGFEGGAKGDRQPSLYTTADLWVSSLARRRVSSAQGNDEGGRADGCKPINGNPAAGKLLEQAPAVFCHTVDIYSKKTLGAGLILHPPPVTMTSLTPYKVADAVGPDGRRLAGKVGIYRATRGFIKRVTCYIWEKKRSKVESILFSGANLG